MLSYGQFLRWITSVLIFAPFHFIRANENTVFLYNRIESCKPSEYYDVNYFMCRECEPELNLMPSKNGEKRNQNFFKKKQIVKIEVKLIFRKAIYHFYLSIVGDMWQFHD